MMLISIEPARARGVDSAIRQFLGGWQQSVADAMRSQIVSGAPVKLELLELLAIEGVALRSIASGPQALFCSDVGAGSPALRIGMTTKSPAFGRAIRKHSERDEANTLGQNSHKSLFALAAAGRRSAAARTISKLVQLKRERGLLAERIARSPIPLFIGTMG
jgi:hypothetical protein